MNGEVDGVASRPRPLSGGLWSLLSWIRRDDRDSSSESISSAGSDRTAASFAFLPPANYSVGNTSTILPVIDPPTDSYKKRVYERNVRRHYERDLTLHRKYGLYRSEGGTGYETFTLQNRRPDSDSIGKWSRERRATSECLQRRLAHVPGKRRAPLPPTCTLPTPGTTLSRRTRKRPAPLPPLRTVQRPNESIKLNTDLVEMNSKLNHSDHSVHMYDASPDCKSEKYVKKDTNLKDCKTRSEKSFLKQIFENRKKNSTTESTTLKLLPNISELDKQAAEIIENGKLKAIEQNQNIFGVEVSNPNDSKIKGESWFCTKCLKKYNASVEECLYCFPEFKVNSLESPRNIITYVKNEICTQTDAGLASPSTSRNNKIEDKQKLKEMLKEMKDSLPKKSKINKDSVVKAENNQSLENNTVKNPIVSETPTLRIGSSIDDKEKPIHINEASSLGVQSQPTQLESCNVKGVDLKQAGKLSNVSKPIKGNTKITELLLKLPKSKSSSEKGSDKLKNDHKKDVNSISSNSSNKRDIHIPLRISSLLNPMYIPKNNDSINKSPNGKGTANINSAININVTNSTETTLTTAATSNSGPITSTTIPIVPETKSQTTASSKINKEVIKITDQNLLPTSCEKIKENYLETVEQPKRKITQNNELPSIKEEVVKLKHLNSNIKEDDINNKPSTSISTDPANVCSTSVSKELGRLNQHARRRELVNQLEKSISSGDEQAAADAAVKLAQLKLSCSVLSFSSQIVTEPSTSSPKDKPTNLSKHIQPEIHKLLRPFGSQNGDKNIIAQNAVKVPVKKTIQLEQTSTGTETKITSSSLQNKPLKNKIILEKKDIQIHQSGPSVESKIAEEKKDNNVSIQVWVEDKEAVRGPINLNTQRQARMGELRMQAETVLGLPNRLQRWIVGRTLCNDDNIPIASLAGPDFNAPFYLCLVEPGQADESKPSTSRLQVDEKRNAPKEGDQHIHKVKGSGMAKAIGENTVKAIVQDTVKIVMQSEDQAANVYKELVKLEQQALVPNAELFECGVCMEECLPDRGVILRECVHTFCRDCLSDLVRHCEEPDVQCPAMGCRGMLQEREIRALVTPEDYERWLARGLAAAESGTRNAFHCRTNDCAGWALCDPGVLKFPCPVCKHTNCVPCQAIHEGETCKSYQSKLQAIKNVDSGQIDSSTRALIDTLINKGEALECPECKAIITKKWGCDWVKCSACKTEICWVTKGKRWGPGGRGDTSAGCRCGVEGKKCHPSCGYCH